MGIFGKIINKFRNKNNEEEKYLKIAREHINKAGENLTKEQINEMMKLGMDTRELYPEVSKLYFERIEDYFPHASTMLATFYMDKDDEMYEKYCLKAANQGENIAKKSLAIFYAKNNNEEKMLEWYNKLDDKEDYDVLAYMSNYYMFQDNYDKVKEINFTILKNKKDDKYAPNCLGDAYFAEGDFENSEKYYKIALENGSPDSKDKLFNLYQTTENIEKFRELIEKDETKRGEDLLSLGNLYFHKKDYKMAEKWYLESEKLGFLEAKYNLGYVYYEIGNFDKTEKYFQEVIEKIPYLKESAIKKLINVYNSQANVYLTSGDFDKAEKYLKILVENAKEWDKKIKDAAGEDLFEIIEDDNWPRSDFEEEDIPNLINDIEKYIGKEEADNLRNGNFTREAFKNLLYVSSITMDNNGCFNVGLFDIDYIMFGGHILFIDGNINGEFYGGDMAG